MMTRTLLARCAPLAIAASAALPSIAFAQDTTTAQPVIVLPEAAPVAAPAPSAAPAPAIVLPEAVSEPAPVAAQVATTQAEPQAQRAATPQRSTQRAAVGPREAAPAPAVAPMAQAEPQSPEAVPAVVAPNAPSTAETVADTPAVAASNDNATSEIALAGLLGALGLAAVGGVAFAASRRRRRHDPESEIYESDHAYEPIIESEEIAQPVQPQPVAARTVDPVPAFANPAPVASAFSTPVVASASAPRTLARTNGDPIALPNDVPDTFEERDALLKELVAAEPDKANPFTSPRARARRAKLIIQSLGRDFTSRKPRFDLSEYTNRWPALRGWQPATA